MAESAIRQGIMPIGLVQALEAHPTSRSTRWEIIMETAGVPLIAMPD
jgi:hypothetical protein